MMRFGLRFAAVVAIPIALVGALVVAVAVAQLYMVLVEGVAPGEPISPEDLAPTVGGGLFSFGYGAALIAASLIMRAIARRGLRKLEAQQSSTGTPSNNALERTRNG